MIKIDTIGPIRVFRLARTILGRGLYFTAAYWVDGLMVDTGCAHTVSEFLVALEDLPVHSIVNTHSHEDHVAGNARLQAKRGARALTHPAAIRTLAEPRSVRLRPYQLVMWGYPEPSMASPVGETIETDRHRFRVVPTPGHSPDHICLYEPSEGWLFVGDAYVGGQDRALRADYNIWQIIESLKVLASLDGSLVLPGSGNVRSDPKQAFGSKIEYLEDLGHRVLELHEKGWSIRRIRKALLGRELSIAYFTLGNFSGRHLVRSYIDDRKSSTSRG